MRYILGIKKNGEILRFELWVYEAFVTKRLKDGALLQFLNSCVEFRGSI